MICLLLLLLLTGMTIKNTESGSDTTVEVKFAIEVPFAVINFIDEDEILRGIKAFVPLYINITDEFLSDVDIYDQDGKIGVAIVIPSRTQNIHYVMVQVKTLVTCSTPIPVPISLGGNTPDVRADPHSFKVEYSAGVDPVLTGDELIKCSGLTIDPIAGTTRPIITLKFAIEVPFGVISLIDEDEILRGIKAFVPHHIDISGEYLSDVDIYDQDGKIGVAIALPSHTPNIHHVMIQVKTFITCGSQIPVPISLGGETPDITVDPRSFKVEYSAGVDPVLTGDELIKCPGLTIGPITEPRPTKKPTAVKFAIDAPFAVIRLIDEDEILRGIKAFVPLYFDITAEYLSDVDIYDQDGKIGVAIVISSDKPNIHHVLVQVKTFVTCGTSIPVPIAGNIPDIKADPHSFKVEYSVGVDLVFTGDEWINCPGLSIEATTGTTRSITRRPTKKPSAGCGKTSGKKLISTLVLLMVALIVY